MAKRIWPDRGDAYSRAKHLDVSTVSVAGLDDISALLGRLISDPRAAVMRGELIDAGKTQGVRRLQYPDHKTGELATFRDEPRRWLALDIEGINLPATLPAADLAGCAAISILRRPAAIC